jgi:hypothetical protein
MPPRKRRQVVPPQDETPAPTGTGKPDSAVRRSRTRMQTGTGTPQDEEQFDLGAISSSEDGYNEQPPSDHGCDADSLAHGGNSHNHVNDPDTAPRPKTTAYDIRYFFIKSGNKVVCHICRQVFLRSRLFSFLN